MLFWSFPCWPVVQWQDTGLWSLEWRFESSPASQHPRRTGCPPGNLGALHGAKDSILNERQFQFEWDEIKAGANLRKHGVSFELASTVFNDPRLLTVADLEHSEIEERWFSIGWASNSAMLSVVYLWSESDLATKIRFISAREATQTEIRHYQESL